MQCYALKNERDVGIKLDVYENLRIVLEGVHEFVLINKDFNAKMGITTTDKRKQWVPAYMKNEIKMKINLWVEFSKLEKN